MVKNYTASSSLLGLFLGAAGLMPGAASSVGMAYLSAGGVLNGSAVSGDVTVFDGSRIKSAGYTKIQLSQGARLDLNAGASAQVFANRATLEQGIGEARGNRFELSAATLRIQPEDGGAVARVDVQDPKHVVVMALNGVVSVRNAEGFVVQRVLPTRSVLFMPQAAAGNAYDNPGCLLRKGDTAILADSTGTNIVQLTGSKEELRKVEKGFGKKAEIHGVVASEPSTMGANSVVIVKSVGVSSESCTDVAAKVAGATVAAGAISGIAATAGATTVAATAAVTAAAVSTGVIAGVGIAAAAAIGVGVAVGTKGGS